MSYAAPDSQLRRVTRHSTRDSTARSIHRQLSVIPGTRPIKRWNYSQDPDNLWKRLRYWGYPTYGAYEGIEALDHFRPGGYHPIHLQDELDNGRYRVIHKLYIHWDAAVSWLCRDQHAEIPRYVDVHILTADESGAEEIATAKKIRDMCKDEPDLHRRLRLPPRDFTSHSANGTHICLVYPVLGPQVEQAADIFGGHYVDSVETDSEGSVDSGLDCMDRDISDLNDTEAAHGHAESWDSDDFMSDSDLEDPVNELEREMFNSRMLRGLCRDTVEAVTMLHKRGLCHRGLSPQTIFIEMDTLDGKDEDHVLSLLGGPETFPVLRLVDNLPTPDIPNAPDYIVYPVRFRGVASSLLQPRVRLDGFFDLWDTHNQPFERDPELITMSYAAPELATDGVCSLPIDLWALGCLLFTIRTGAELFRSVQNRSLYDPEDDDSPEEARKDYFDAVCKVLSKPPGLWSRYYSPEKPSYMRPEPDRSHPETEAERRQRRLAGIRRAIRSNLKRPDSLYTYTHWLSRLPPMEVRTLADLLERLLRYEPHERIDASAVLQHAWFNGLDDGVAK